MADTSIGLFLETGRARGEVTDLALRDQLLLVGLQAGEEQAYETLIGLYSQPVYSIVYRLLSDPGEANDVVQEVFLKIFRNMAKFRGDCSLKTWIYRIAVNEAHNHRRWFSRHKRQEVGLDGEDEDTQCYSEQLADPGRNPFDITLSHEQKLRIEEALGKLKPIFKAAVVLRDIEDLSYDEIAGIMQVSLGTVKTRILRGRDQLRKILLEQESADALQKYLAAETVIG